MPESSLGDLIDRWNQGDEAALVEIYDRWGERIIRAVYRNSRVSRGTPIYGSSDMRQTVLRWMLMYARARRIYATRPEHVEALFRTFVKRAVLRADKKIRDEHDLARLADEAQAVPGSTVAEEQRTLIERAKRCFAPKDWEAIDLVSRGVPQRTVAEMQGRSYQYLRLQLARRRGAARRELTP